MGRFGTPYPSSPASLVHPPTFPILNTTAPNTTLADVQSSTPCPHAIRCCWRAPRMDWSSYTVQNFPFPMPVQLFCRSAVTPFPNPLSTLTHPTQYRTRPKPPVKSGDYRLARYATPIIMASHCPLSTATLLLLSMLPCP